ncbi:Hsp20/alpha crystallin family protein [Fibrobacterota bacterium]
MKTAIKHAAIAIRNNCSYLNRGSQPALIKESNRNISILINFPHVIRRNCYIEYDNWGMTVHPGFSRFSKGDHNVCFRLGNDLNLQLVKPELKGKVLRITIPKKEKRCEKPLKKAA